MTRYLLRKIRDLFVTLWGITLISFILIRLVPGDPILMQAGEQGLSPENYSRIKKEMGLDRPLPIQYLMYLGNILQGDLGDSYQSRRPVMEEFFARFPATLELGITALLLATVIGIPLGIMAAIKHRSLWDYLLMGGALLGYSMPIFWWGLILILVFSVTLGLTPVSGRIDILYEVESWSGFYLIDTLHPKVLSDEGFSPFFSALKHLILPALALGTIPLAIISRMTRSNMLDVLSCEYIRTAKGKGLSPFRIVTFHALRNALIPIITIIGLMFGSIITGAILTETIFAWPGIGKWMVSSIEALDYKSVQGGVLLIGVMVILVNLTTDLLYLLVNPRVKT